MEVNLCAANENVGLIRTEDNFRANSHFEKINKVIFKEIIFMNNDIEFLNI